MIQILQPLQLVFWPSMITILLGYMMDFFISTNTLLNYFYEIPQLYIDGIKASIINLLIISPINYIIAFNYLFSSDMFSPGIQFIKLILMILKLNVLYYLFHSAVHKYPKLRFIHDFHHKFRTNLPSIGNAVSIYEFQFMYVLPFLIGLFIIKPNIITFNMSIYIISLLNLIIHCNEFQEIGWIQGLVSPEKHGKHHKNYFGNYSAPLLDLDYIFKSKK